MGWEPAETCCIVGIPNLQMDINLHSATSSRAVLDGKFIDKVAMLRKCNKCKAVIIAEIGIAPNQRHDVGMRSVILEIGHNGL